MIHTVCFIIVLAVSLSASLSFSAESSSLTWHEPFIRQAFQLAVTAGKKGDHPFGALLVYRNNVILTAGNTVYTDKNVHSHAEINLMTEARRTIAPEVLRESTMYVSTAPCMLCCSSMWARGIGRVVYGVSYTTFSKITGISDTSIPCNRLYRETGKTLEWIGPVLEEEGVQVFHYWPHDPSRASIIKNLGLLGVKRP